MRVTPRGRAPAGARCRAPGRWPRRRRRPPPPAARRAWRPRRWSASGAGSGASTLSARKPMTALVGAGHADVGDEGGAAGQDALVGGRHVGVGADDRRDPPVEVDAERLLLAGRLGVEVDEHDRAFAGELAEQLGRRARNGQSTLLHEDLALEVDHRHRRCPPRSRRRGRRARGCRPGSWPGAAAAARARGGRRPPSCPRCGCRRSCSRSGSSSSSSSTSGVTPKPPAAFSTLTIT